MNSDSKKLCELFPGLYLAQDAIKNLIKGLLYEKNQHKAVEGSEYTLFLTQW